MILLMQAGFLSFECLAGGGGGVWGVKEASAFRLWSAPSERREHPKQMGVKNDHRLDNTETSLYTIPVSLV